jgi:hypothetical protein
MMARTSGPGHCEDLRGKIGGITHRGHRELSVVSGSKLYFKRRRPVLRGWEPDDETNLQYWHRIPDRCTLRTVGLDTFITNWNDKTAFLRDYIQAEDVRQPKMIDGGVEYKGHPYALFDGSNDYMLSLILTTPVDQPMTVFVVVNEPSGLTVNRQILGLHSAGVDGLRWYVNGTNKFEIRLSTPTCRIIQGTGVVKLWTLIFNGVASSIRWNNVQMSAIGNVGNQTINQLAVASRTSIGNYANIKIFEDFCISGAPSERIMQSAWAYASKRYGLPK